MGTDFPYLYRYSRAEARRHKETQMHGDSFHWNVLCAREIERAISGCYSEAEDRLAEGCAQPVLERYGFKRVTFVLANSLKEMGCKYLTGDETRQWGKQIFVPDDGKYNRYYEVDTAAGLLEAFIAQVRQAYQALGLFGPEHCIGDMASLELAGKVLVLSPDTLKENHWTPRDQLWYAETGFGCSPHARGQAVYATCLGDGERTRWDRIDFTGVLDERFLPDWAREKLQELRGLKQEQGGGPTMGGMAME